jgi:soluble P-type ATPase
MVGVGRGAGLGVLIKNAEALELMEKVNTLVVDKTGTLTEGRPSVTQVVPAAGFEDHELVRLAAGGERASDHPLARAIVKAATDAGVTIPDVTDFDSPPGKGAVGTVENRRILIGSANYLAGEGLDTSALTADADRLRGDGATAIFMGVDDQVAGIFAIADPVKDTTPDALQSLGAEGIEVVMLTGDNRVTAEAVGRRLGVHRIEAEVLPDHKSDIVKQLRADGRVVPMAGDGVNDAPALAAADVGLAMSSGTDVAMESAGVTLLKGDLTGIVRARKLSQATMSNIRQNRLRVHLQRRRHPHRRRQPLPHVWAPALPDDRRRRHGPLISQCHQQRPAPPSPAPLGGQKLEIRKMRRRPRRRHASADPSTGPQPRSTTPNEGDPSRRRRPTPQRRRQRRSPARTPYPPPNVRLAGKLLALTSATRRRLPNNWTERYMKLELFYFDGCPNWAVAEERLREALHLSGHSDVLIQRHGVQTLEQAAKVGFLGSPTVRIDGRDPFAQAGEQVALSCRVFSTPAGLAGSPTVEQLVEALS